MTRYRSTPPPERHPDVRYGDLSLIYDCPHCGAECDCDSLSDHVRRAHLEYVNPPVTKWEVDEGRRTARRYVTGGMAWDWSVMDAHADGSWVVQRPGRNVKDGERGEAGDLDSAMRAADEAGRREYTLPRRG